MAVLVFAEIAEGEIKKSSQEAIYYGSKVAEMLGTENIVLAIGPADSAQLSLAGRFGASKVLHANGSELSNPNIMAYSDLLTAAVQQTSASVVVSAKSSLADPVTARTAGALKAGIVGNVTSLPNIGADFTVTRSIFTGKAYAQTVINTAVKILGIKKNTIVLEEKEQNAAVENFGTTINAKAFESKTLETIKAKGIVPLPEADLVVSGGRGLKAPENWQPLLDLADALGASTACSKPVSDLDWRPHHEHVGQTGVKIAPNLYIACGISGAIQHLAGVNASKVIVVINTDADAPFFQAADYGIIGDAFEVLPKLTAAVKALN